MSKEKLDNQAVSVEGGLAAPEKNHEKVINQAKEVVKKIDEGVDFVLDSGKKMKVDFRGKPELVKTIEKADQEVGMKANDSKQSILSLLRGGIGRKFIQTAAALGLFMGAEKFSRAEGVIPEKDKYLIENKDNGEGRTAVLGSINPEGNVEKKDSLQNPKPEDYDLNLYHPVDSTKAEREKQEYKEALNNPELAKKIVEQSILERKTKKIDNELYFAKQDLTKIMKNGGAPEEIEKKNQEIMALNSKKQAVLSGKISLELSPEEEACINNAPTVFADIELARSLALKGFEGEDYVKRLANEFGISKEEAKEHQKMRINNIKNCQIHFFFQADSRGEYASYGAGVVNVPVISDNTLFNVEALTHEFRHAATDADNGLSEKAKKILAEETFNQEGNFGDLISGKDYYGKPTERDVRKKALEDELNLMGIKKYREKFTKEKYQKMMEMYKQNPGSFSLDAQNFIKYTKDFDDPEKGYENFRKMFEDLAANQKEKSTDSVGGTYQHPSWDYSGTEKSV